jgi:carotenoid cleavage dioxygenase
MIHSVQFNNGNAYYSNKFIHTDKFKVEKNLGKSVGFGLKHILDPFSMIVSYVKKKWIYKIKEDTNWTSNTSLLYHNDKLFALVENQLPFEMDVDTLKSVSEKSN